MFANECKHHVWGAPLPLRGSGEWVPMLLCGRDDDLEYPSSCKFCTFRVMSNNEPVYCESREE